jgi:hypothetical protein
MAPPAIPCAILGAVCVRLGELVAAQAVGLHGPDRSRHVLGMRDGFKMLRIHASPVAAEVI